MKDIYVDLRENLQDKFEYYQQDIKDSDVMDLGVSLREAIQRNDSFKLFRYMPPTYYSIRNFEKQRIHLSPKGLMNDVFEGVPESEGLPYEELKKLNDLAYMTCLSETNDNPLMWGHYADGHNGFCVEYDLKLLSKDPYKICGHLFPVIYTPNRIDRDIRSLIASHNDLNNAIEGDYEYDGDEPLDDILPLFLTKGTEWKYEREWRIVYSRKQMYDENDKTLYEGNLNFPCVSAVYMGYRINKEMKENLIEIAERISNAEKRDIHVYQAKLEEAGNGIKFEKVL
ncbi:MAG: DUF2971 domain-containing protein [Bacteroides thetaiotaomicron]|nr:DUF2971 domain-containing protein [Bacteroides thetaiotaomicron]